MLLHSVAFRYILPASGAPYDEVGNGTICQTADHTSRQGIFSITAPSLAARACRLAVTSLQNANGVFDPTHHLLSQTRVVFPALNSTVPRVI